MIKSFFCVYLLFILLVLKTSNATNIDTKIIFQTELIGPSMIESCKDFLWTYSVKDNIIYKLSPSNGTIIKSYKAPESSHVTAISCYQEEIIFATIKKSKLNNEYHLYKLNRKEQNQLIKHKFTTIISDIFSYQQHCYLITNKILHSTDLKNFSKLALPKSEDMTLKKALPNDINPFSEWQDKHIIGREKYSRGIFSTHGDLYLLDAIRINIIRYKAFTDTKNHIAKNFIKWGKWGTWEEQLMYPKGLALLSPYKKIIISDSGLKLLFLFTYAGDYWGKIAMDTKETRFKYPIDITTMGKTIFIADFKANKVIAMLVKNIGGKREKIAHNMDDLLHRDLFKNHAVLQTFYETRCLNCHDGLVTYNLPKFLNLKKFHPINIPVDTSSDDLPLMGKKLLYCSSCHDNHHQMKNGIPFYLRKQYRSLCSSCHEENSNSKNNHIDLKSKTARNKFNVDSCEKCHQMHQAEENLTVKKEPDLCIECHGKNQIPKAHPVNKKDKSLFYCTSCHSIHKSLETTSYAKINNEENSYTCINCHNDKEKLLNKNAHMKIKKDTLRKGWNPNELICLDCHNPHKKKKSVRETCVKCHDNRPIVHKKKNPLIHTPRAANISFENEKITCSTCHNQHGSNTKNYLKNKEGLIMFCSACHDKEATKLFNKYHELTTGKKKKD